mmetsp:Transcript_1297/g.1368  ORF Transcript_1297/g.1368 Transcript_1297/m.1368 type:complete len:336 (+) Transcript_1297:130-1137(+)
MTASIPYAAAFFSWTRIYFERWKALPESTQANVRSFQTPADEFYRKYKKIPPPSTPHAILPELAAAKERMGNDEEYKMNQEKKKNILVVGDCHGCYDELLELHAKAVKENNNIQFKYVLLVGDLCNKGPESTKVIRHVRLASNFFSVRGNHDEGALAAALGERSSRQKKKYHWIEDEHNNHDAALSDDDVSWLAELPYTIKIPGDFFGTSEHNDIIIVHAGFIPNTSSNIEGQEIKTMTTIRDLLPRYDKDRKFTHYEHYKQRKSDDDPIPWASVWDGSFVIFGHDAKRKLQMYEKAIGLDTGAVYGGKLTGLILSSYSERKLVSVQSKEYVSVT